MALLVPPAGAREDVPAVHGWERETCGARGHGPILPGGGAADSATAEILPLLAAEGWTQDSHNNPHVKYKELFKYYLLRLACLQPGPYQGREGR